MNRDETVSRARILVADDEDNTRLALVRALQLSGYQPEGVANGSEALKRLKETSFDLLLLDLCMPEVDGMQVMEYIRQNQLDLAVIVLTANATLDSAIASVKTGAADYLLKPQRMADIELAIRNALKRNAAQRQRKQLIEAAQKTLEILQPGGEPSPAQEDAGSASSHLQPVFRFDAGQRLATIGAGVERNPRVVSLTMDQAAILDYFMRNRGRVVSCQEIARTALGYPKIGAREAEKLVRSHVLRLRSKIEDDPGHPRLVRTIRGSGYVFHHPEYPN
jgi:two-component system alkaline phosphatase synthesis response regulator PhoP